MRPKIPPHILTLKPEPFTPLKRLGIPQTPMEVVENLAGFSTCAYGTYITTQETLQLLFKEKQLRSPSDTILRKEKRDRHLTYNEDFVFC